MADTDHTPVDTPTAQPAGAPTNGTATLTTPIGRVATPANLEATSDQFAFWVRPEQLVEKSQIVHVTSRMGGEDITYYGLIEEVRRRSRRRDIHESYDGTDGDASSDGPYDPEGVTYAQVAILKADPNRLTPPLEQSPVLLGDANVASTAYGFDEMRRPLSIGRLRNGGSHFAGAAQIDLAYLLGDYGGHMNVTGMTGVGTKTSYLLVVLKALLALSARRARTDTERRDPIRVVPVVFNVKGEDLMWIDQQNAEYQERSAEYDPIWEAIGVEPCPFEGTTFFAPTDPNGGSPMIDGCNATAYNWSFHDVLRGGLFPYLFADDDVNERMRALTVDLADYFTAPDGVTPRIASAAPASWDQSQTWPRTWQDLLDWMDGWAASDHSPGVLRAHAQATKGAVNRRLRDVILPGHIIFNLNDVNGAPLDVVRNQTSPPQVIDIHLLPRSLQRFIVASVSKQIVAARTGRDLVRGLRYVIVLDELNRFAPRGASDPVTRLMEEISTERRSQGVILFGAQQFASEVSTKVVESASIRAAGRTGTAELGDRVWKGLSNTARRQASQLHPGEKLVMQPTFREPMLVQVPFPAWAMRREDIAAEPLENFDNV